MPDQLNMTVPTYRLYRHLMNCRLSVLTPTLTDTVGMSVCRWPIQNTDSLHFEPEIEIKGS